MIKKLLKKYHYYIAILSIIATIILLIYTAHPWGENDAYDNFGMYIFLLLIIVWSILPYIPFFFITATHRSAIICRTIGVSLICFPTIAIILDGIFFHPDAQNGISFLFFPFYQWIIVAIFIVIIKVIEKDNVAR